MKLLHFTMAVPNLRFQQPGSKKMKWTPEEDDQLRVAVEAHGTDSWARVSSGVPKRNGKQCRERWLGQLSPSVSKDTWSFEEDALLIEEQERSGNKWAAIAARLPGRTSIQAKNRWHWLVRRQLTLQGDQPPPHSDILESVLPAQTVFQLPPIDDALFGAKFEAFKTSMLASQPYKP
jgi:hypothetical protein